MFLRNILPFVILLFAVNYAVAQNKEIDSLKNTLAVDEHDSTVVDVLIELSAQYRGISLDTALVYAKKAKNLADEIKYPKGQGYALKAIGLAYNMKGDYVEALRFWKDALQVFEKHDIKVGTANMLNNIGVIYYNKSDEQNALDYYLRSLKVSEEIKDTLRIATAYANLGGVYSNKATTYDKSLQYHKKALALSEAIHDSVLIGSSNANIGEILLNQNKLDSAITYLMQGRKVYVGSADLPYILNIIGKVYRAKKQFYQAITFHQQAYDTAAFHDARLDMAQALLGIAESYKEANDAPAAIDVYLKAQVLFEEIGLDESYDLKTVYEGLSACYMKQKNYQKAMEYHTKLLEVKDKIYNIEVDKSLSTKLFAYEIDKKQNEINLQQSVISRQNLVRNGLLGGMLIVLLFASVFFIQRNKIGKEKKRSDALLLNILPEETAEELKQTGTAKAKSFDEVTVLFTDFKNFTRMSEELTAQELVNEIHYCYCAFDDIISQYDIEKIKTIGDSYMCASGLPMENPHHAVEMLKAAFEIREFIDKEKAKRIADNKPYFEIRIGLNSGPVVAGIVGNKKFAYDIWGDAVNIASRMESSGEPGKINVSGATCELVKDHCISTYRGKIEAKNKGAIDMYFVERLETA
ncbi:MAG: tetratricopeptide repeat protein [Bacteroidetes bacterium]|nr:tetratricopeptide repeat protein [Bacteroidota bacterium]